MAVVTSLLPIFISSAAVRGFSFEPVDVLWAAVGLLVFSIPAGVVAALVFKRSDAGLIVSAQLLTALSMAAFSFATA
ncbi:hypothetical protein MNR01_12535 [Lysobacter sp. S4-A87]|uniref:hypothetical protein n=1 Tax=Lysobacter sp. S4-A87 TaxID=2925843 RepID=UPI001F53863D|nr:hypothetical protein [Lysobacter sp. S4-A87]UNK48572.1 hypothetical protein MNR01_12535 [Lysobacter sp. S4-A87]